MRLAFIPLLLIIGSRLFAQEDGHFSITLSTSNQDRSIACYAPEGYANGFSKPLLIGLHGCHPNPSVAVEDYKNALVDLADSYGMLLACPEGLSSAQGFMGQAQDVQLILDLIDKLMLDYGVDGGQAYLTGFSCNGYATMVMGMREAYPFKGVIPFNPGIRNSDFSAGDFTYNTDLSLCLCSGTEDPSYSSVQRVSDSLKANGTDHAFESIQGVGHTYAYSGYTQTLSSCMDYFGAWYASASPAKALKLNWEPASGLLSLQIPEGAYRASIVGLTGRLIRTDQFEHKGGQHELDLPEMASGSYVLSLKAESGKTYYGRFKAEQ